MEVDRPALLASLVQHEGLRLFPYTDTAGKLTIGIGRNLTDRGISAGEAQTLLEHDVDEVIAAVGARWPWVADLDPVRRNVLLEMAFNLGVAGLAGFTRTLAAVEAGDYVGAAERMRISLWARQVKGRAETLAQRMATGVFV